MNILLIIESPFKAPTIKSILGKGYKVASSKGHVRDLPKSRLGIEIENGYEPKYMNIRGKGDLIKELKKEAKKADLVLLATDPDREGEAISWHLMQALELDSNKAKRITFNSLTKSAIKDAIKHPRDIDMNLVDSQQTRRILDRLVGYKISPFLWKKIESGLSAGRVQSVATRMIVERDEEIKAFVPEEYWNITSRLTNQKGDEFTARFYGTKDSKTELNTKADVDKVLDAVSHSSWTVGEIKKSVKLRKPLPPFTTSTLQQEANRRFSFPSQKTMSLAQELYEGVNLGGDKGMHGLITYMRTDSVRVSGEARDQAKDFIVKAYGDKYYPETPNVYKSKGNSQDAHEAIRPTEPSLTPDMVKGRLSADSYRLYKLIWERFIASQMKSAEYDTVSVDINTAGYVFKASGRTVKFMGFMAVYGEIEEDSDEEKGEKLPALNTGEVVEVKEITPEQKFTQPPSRFTEGSLIKMLEEKGIGRPSTYTPTISTIISRGYVNRNGKFLEPTELGKITTKLMVQCFPKIIDYDFTANMEENLDKVEEGSLTRFKVIDDFYKDFEKQLEYADKALDKVKYEKPVIETDIICEKCGARMVVKEGRYGKFAACPNYPNCKNTKRLDKDGSKKEEKQPEVVAAEKCSNCGGEMVLRKGTYGPFFACRNYPECKTTRPYTKETGVACPKCGKNIVMKQSKTKRIFYSCEDYPNCDFSSWDTPTNEKCPVCGKMLLKKKHRNLIYCIDKACGWSEEIRENQGNS